MAQAEERADDGDAAGSGRGGGLDSADAAQAGAAGETEQNRLDLVVGRVPRGDRNAAFGGGSPLEEGVAESPRGHFDRLAGVRGLRGDVRAPDDARHA